MSTPDHRPARRARRRGHVLYPDTYVWLVFLASLDIMLTWIILSPPFEGMEVNKLADWVIQTGGLKATVAYKFVLIVIVITICEIVGRRRLETGARLGAWCVAIQIIPVVVALAQLLLDVAYTYHMARAGAPEI